MLLTCPKCKTKNFLDPYPFWNFKGTTKCAGCSAIWQAGLFGHLRCGADPVGASRPQGRDLQTNSNRTQRAR